MLQFAAETFVIEPSPLLWLWAVYTLLAIVGGMLLVRAGAWAWVVAGILTGGLIYVAAVLIFVRMRLVGRVDTSGAAPVRTTETPPGAP